MNKTKARTLRIPAGEVQPGDRVEIGSLWREVTAVSSRPSEYFPERDVAVWQIAEYRIPAPDEDGEPLVWRAIEHAIYYTINIVRVRR